MRVDDLSWTKEMIWSEKEAAQFQVDQIGTSACGATAVINTLVNLTIYKNKILCYIITKYMTQF